MNLDRMMKSLDRFSFSARGEGSDVEEQEVADINNNVASNNEEKYSSSDQELMKTLLDELDSSKKKQISSERVIEELEKKIEGKEDEAKKMDEKLAELQKSYDNLSQTLDFANKMVEDQRIQLSSGTVKLQHQRDLVSKKELERQKSLKHFENELCTREGYVCNMEKYIDDLEKKLDIYEQSNKEKEIEDKKKSQIVNMQSTELREKSFQAAKLEQKIAGLEHDLQLVNIEHAEQEVQVRKKIATITLVLDALKNKYDLDLEHKEAIVALEKDLAEITYTNTKEGIKKKTRDFVGHWRSKSFHYAKSRSRCMGCFVIGKHCTSRKFALGVGLFAIFLGAVFLLGKQLTTHNGKLQ